MTSIWHHSTNLKSSSFNLHHVSLKFPSKTSTPTARSWQNSGFDQSGKVFTCLWIPCKAYFHQRVRPGLHRKKEHGSIWGFGIKLGRKNTEKLLITQSHDSPHREIWVSSLRAAEQEASRSLLQPISLNILQMYVSVSGPEICSVI